MDNIGDYKAVKKKRRFGRAASSQAATACLRHLWACSSRRAIRSITLCALRARAGASPAPTGGSAAIPLANIRFGLVVCPTRILT